MLDFTKGEYGNGRAGAYSIANAKLREYFALTLP